MTKFQGEERIEKFAGFIALFALLISYLGYFQDCFRGRKAHQKDWNSESTGSLGVYLGFGGCHPCYLIDGEFACDSGGAGQSSEVLKDGFVNCILSYFMSFRG